MPVPGRSNRSPPSTPTTGRSRGSPSNVDNVNSHHGKAVLRWLAAHPRYVPHFTPVHCSWICQVEQWFSILERKRSRHPNFPDRATLTAANRQSIREWNAIAHPFRWTGLFFERILANVEANQPPPILRQETASGVSLLRRGASALFARGPFRPHTARPILEGETAPCPL
ncbi:MAG: transposase [Dehalococcoidia bacterium]